jgi:hypothetical protein
MPQTVSVGDVVYPTYDAGESGLHPGVQVVNKRTGAALLARTTSGIVEQPTGSGSYDYTTGFIVPLGVSVFKIGWTNDSGDVLVSEDYVVTNSDVKDFTIALGPWPPGTVVSLYLAQSDVASQPSGTALQTATVAADGSVAFVNLTVSRDYVAAALVSGTWLRVRFHVP